MNRPAHLVAIEGDAAPAPDPLREARAAGNAHVDAGLDALNVALEHFRRAEPYAALLPVGVMQLVEGWKRTIPQGVLAVTVIRDRSGR